MGITWRNRLEIRFETLCGDKFEKKRAKNGVFVSKFYFGKCVQNTWKNRFEMNAFFIRFETSSENKYEKKT